MRRRRLTTAIVTTASLATLCGLAAAQTRTPTRVDFENCNRVAKAQIGPNASGSALPRSGSATTPPDSSSSGSTSGSYSSGSSGSSSGSSSMPPSSSGSSSGSPSSGMGSGSGSSATSPSATAPRGNTTDPTLMGMDPAGRDNIAYEHAYRDCMKARGF